MRKLILTNVQSVPKICFPIIFRQVYILKRNVELFRKVMYCHVTYLTIDGVLDRRLDLLTTLTRDSWLHLIIGPSLISTLYKSLEPTLSFSVCCVFSHSLVTASNSGDSSAFALTLLSAGSQLHQVFSSQTLLQFWRTQSHSQSYFTTGGLRQTIRLGSKPLETHDQ
jgi:hypothetical protein